MEDKPLVTISVPAYNAKDHILRCVESLLAQTIDNIKIYVINDAGPEDDLKILDTIDDPRLVVARSEVNRGRYAIDHHVAMVTEGKWFAVCDADDWVEPTWLESMIRAWDGESKVVVAPHYEHSLKTGEAELRPVAKYDGKFRWHTHMGACLWDAEWVRDVHATNPYVRVGWDNVMTGLPFVLRAGCRSSFAAYHRVNRVGSLTRSADTGMKSPLRQQTVKELRQVWSEIVRHPEQTFTIVAGMNSTKNVSWLLKDSRIVRSSWALQMAGLVELDAYLWRNQPRNVVEFGSGVSTVVLANYAQQTGAKVTSFEHASRYKRETEQKLRSARLQGVTDLRLAALKGSPPAYDGEMPDGVDFVLIDGPPEYTGGRAAILPLIYDCLADNWEAWLDDASRDLEQEALKSWRKDLGVSVSKQNIPADFVSVTPKRRYQKKVVADGVVIGLLTGWRPETLCETLASLPKGLLESAYVIVLHDGGDEETSEVLEPYSEHFDVYLRTVPESGKMHSIGENMSRLVEAADGHGDFFFMLEDDWRFATADPTWLNKAMQVLEGGNVAQVRLRHASEQVLSRHMVTNKPIVWKPFDGGMIGAAHLTTNPSLVRVDDLKKMWPADGERGMQKNAVDNGLTTVWQSYPGAFHHIGVRSMRAETNCQP